MTKLETTWRALFFSGHSETGQRVLKTLQAASDAEMSQTVATLWADHSKALQAIEQTRQGKLAAATLTLDERLRSAKLNYEKDLADGVDVERAVEGFLQRRVEAVSKRDNVVSDAEGRAKRDAKAAEDALAALDFANVGERLDQAMKCVDRSRKLAEPRFIGGAGEIVKTFVFYGGDRSKPPTIEAKEVERESRIAQDLGTLGKLFLSGTFPASTARNEGAPKELRTIFISVDQYSLTKKRGTLTFAASPAKEAGGRGRTTNPLSIEGTPPPKDGLTLIADSVAKVAVALEAKPEATNGASATQTGAAGAATSSVVTGPREHWFLSVNVNVRKFDDVTFDEASRSFVPSAQTPRFLVGANYFFGDVASTRSSALFASLLFEPSKKPTSAVGIGLGLRLRSVKASFLEIDGFSPFAGFLRISGEATEGRPAPPSEWRWVFGLTFNLDKAVDWVKK